MIDKQSLQKYYNKLIRYANINYVNSTQDMFVGIQDILLSKAEAFEDAAALFANDFPEVNQVTTMRFNAIREHHLEEETEPKQKADAET